MAIHPQREQRRFGAVDLGAETGRVAVGAFDGDQLQLEVIHRFPTPVVRRPDSLHWDVRAIFREVKAGLRKAGPLDGVGVDAWGCDYAALGSHGELLGLPFHYRDGSVARAVDDVGELVPAAELFARTGIQHLPFNTIYQLHRDRAAIENAHHILLIPDLINYWLTGIAANEETAASTTALTEATTRTWARDLVGRLGLPPTPFAGDLVASGVELGPTRRDLEVGETLVRTSAGHDTAAAFAAVSSTSTRVGVISSGTWSLVGREISEPVLSGLAHELNLSNEWGAGGSTRLLKNVMGLWLLQELVRTSPETGSYAKLEELAEAARDDVPLFDPDDEVFLRPGDVRARIASACEQSGQSAPETIGEVARAILQSLACKYRIVIDELRAVTGELDCIHVVGGGSRNRLLCQLTANAVGLPLLAGPAEATAIGNVLVQGQAAGLFASSDEASECVAGSFMLTSYEPQGDEAVVERFRSTVTAAPAWVST